MASKAKVTMFAWKHPAATIGSGSGSGSGSGTGGGNVPLAPQAHTNPAKSFIKHRVSGLGLLVDFEKKCMMCVYTCIVAINSLSGNNL